MTAPSLWPPALAGTPAVAVIERAIERQRLSHSILLHGDDHDTLIAVAHAIADRLLHAPGSASHFAPAEHPDCFHLRPSGKARQIRIGDSASDTGTMRAFIAKLSVSAAVSTRKVGIIYEAERMNVPTANAFLKTLEEPPANTTLLLLTTHPYALLPTIRSRTLHFRFPKAVNADLAGREGWDNWLADYRALLGRLVEGVTDKRAASDHILSAYGLIARFGIVLDQATAAAWEKQKLTLPTELEDDEKIAIETGLANGLRVRLFADIEHATRAFALPRLTAGDESTRRALSAAVEKLESSAGLLRVNLNESAALEDFFLASLRIWSRR